MTQRTSIRAYRPSTLSFDPEAIEEARRIRELSIELYARLVREGRILFEDEEDLDDLDPVDPAPAAEAEPTAEELLAV